MLQNFLNKIETLENFDFGKAQEEVISQNLGEIKRRQIEQLNAGRDGDNSPIKLYDPVSGHYSDGYAYNTIYGVTGKYKGKIEKGQPYEIVTWRDTGRLHESLEPVLQNSTLTLFTRGEQEKFDNMIIRSGEKTTELNEVSRTEFAETITVPGVIRMFQDAWTKNN